VGDENRQPLGCCLSTTARSGFFAFGQEEVMEQEFIGSNEAARRLGVAPLTLRQRIRGGEVPLFEDPLDARRKLIRRSDLDALRHPRPARREALAEISAA
jgi:hypothetical protein